MIGTKIDGFEYSRKEAATLGDLFSLEVLMDSEDKLVQMSPGGRIFMLSDTQNRWRRSRTQDVTQPLYTTKKVAVVEPRGHEEAAKWAVNTRHVLVNIDNGCRVKFDGVFWRLQLGSDEHWAQGSGPRAGFKYKPLKGDW